MFSLVATGFYQNKERRRAQSHILDDNKKVSNLKSEISGSPKIWLILYKASLLCEWIKIKKKILQILNLDWVLLRNAITQDDDYKYRLLIFH